MKSRNKEITSPLDDLLYKLGVKRNDIPPVTNGDLKQIAVSDTVTIHGWLYLGRGLSEAEKQLLRKHFIQYRSVFDSSDSRLTRRHVALETPCRLIAFAEADDALTADLTRR